MKRHLFVVPIYHTTAELGSLGQREPLSDAKEKAIQKYWRRVTEMIRSFPVDYSRILVYQDSIPDMSDEMINNWLFTSPQTPNYDLLRFLKEKGGRLVGTESLQLLFEHADYIDQISTSDEHKNELYLKYLEGNREFINSRDLYIADRIDQTLTERELGILFIGALHDVKRFLPDGIIAATTRDSKDVIDLFFSEVLEKTRPILGKEKE